MKLLENEEILWQNKGENLVLTNYRIRYEYNGIFGSTIKSIMLEELSSCELRTVVEWGLLKRAITYFLIFNGSVFLINQYLFKAKLFTLLFGEVSIGAGWVQVIFYFSLIIAAWFIILFFLSISKVFSFHTIGVTIDIQLRWLSFEERESFISIVEQAKDKRLKQLGGAV